jgi:hypothetical protein
VFSAILIDGYTGKRHSVDVVVEQPNLLTYLSTHPRDAARVAAIRRMARGEGDDFTPEEWQALKMICETEKPQNNLFSALLR